MDWGGSNVAGPAYTTTAGAKLMMEIINANSLTAQKILNASTFAAHSFGTYIAFKDTTAM